MLIPNRVGSTMSKRHAAVTGLPPAPPSRFVRMGQDSPIGCREWDGSTRRGKPVYGLLDARIAVWIECHKFIPSRIVSVCGSVICCNVQHMKGYVKSCPNTDERGCDEKGNYIPVHLRPDTVFNVMNEWIFGEHRNLFDLVKGLAGRYTMHTVRNVYLYRHRYELLYKVTNGRYFTNDMRNPNPKTP